MSRSEPNRRPGLYKATPRLPVADLKRTVAFYIERLGFKLRVLWPSEKPAFALLESEGVRLAFDQVENFLGPGAQSAAGFYLHTGDVRGTHHALKNLVPIEWGPEVYTYGCREFAIRDPDGYLIIFSEATNHPTTCDEP